MGKLAEIKTKETEAGVMDFVNGLKEQQREDSLVLIKLMQQLSKEQPKLWGSAMIGFGKKTYTSPATGRKVEWFIIGFSPRKANLSLHLVVDIKQHAERLKKLGKHKTGVGCLYINKLADIDLKILEELIRASLKGKRE